jgi:lipopolysaccharide/colanic/teichoic acid biosynthesis glycosyltransferase
MIIIMMVISIDSKGPIIFSQERVGRNHKHFKMYKFRSMRLDAEAELDYLKEKNEMSGPMFKMREDPRVTKIGRFIRRTSMDELPQLINVLKGEMSLVGPRPSLPSEVCDFEQWMLQRLQVKPGLTCYWQVRGRNDIGFREWMELDCQYIVERSIVVDINLILKTICMLLGDRHAR